jgi:hypothetical protein
MSKASQTPPKDKKLAPWQAAGMSRATWYRYGKPGPGYHPRITMKDVVRQTQSKLRTAERLARIVRAAEWYPEPAALLREGKISIGKAESMVSERVRELRIAGVWEDLREKLIETGHRSPR